MTEVTITMSMIRPDGQEIFQQVQVDRQDLETQLPDLSPLVQQYRALAIAFDKYVASQPP